MVPARTPTPAHEDRRVTGVATAPPSLPPAPRRSRLRVALYSHDTQGLGHIRRNLAIADALSRSGDPDVLLLSGAAEARAFALPPRTDAVTLPALSKDAAGRYRARRLSASLHEVVELRARTIDATLDVFAPDVLIVDKVARGALGELEPVLTRLRATGRTKVVLGLRDVLDERATARREWRETRTNEALRCWYDAIWVYGDPRVADHPSGYGLAPDLASLVRHTGYLVPAGSDWSHPPLRSRPYVLCCVGGGQDGAPLAEAFLAADPPEGHDAVVVTGPYFPAAARRRLRAQTEGAANRIVVGAIDDSRPVIAGAAAVVAMGGYNTTVELLAARRRTLVVPRVTPRQEQKVRAERLAALGLVHVCDPAALQPERLSTWLRTAITSEPPTPDDVLDLGGLQRLPALLADLVGVSDQNRSRRAAS